MRTTLSASEAQRRRFSTNVGVGPTSPEGPFIVRRLVPRVRGPALRRGRIRQLSARPPGCRRRWPLDEVGLSQPQVVRSVRYGTVDLRFPARTMAGRRSERCEHGGHGDGRSNGCHPGKVGIQDKRPGWRRRGMPHSLRLGAPATGWEAARAYRQGRDDRTLAELDDRHRLRDGFALACPDRAPGLRIRPLGLRKHQPDVLRRRAGVDQARELASSSGRGEVVGTVVAHPEPLAVTPRDSRATAGSRPPLAQRRDDERVAPREMRSSPPDTRASPATNRLSLEPSLAGTWLVGRSRSALAEAWTSDAGTHRRTIEALRDSSGPHRHSSETACAGSHWRVGWFASLLLL